MKANGQSITNISFVHALIISLIIAVSVPAGYFVIAYQYMAGTVNTEMEYSTRFIEELVAKNPKSWQFEEIRLQEILNRRLSHHYADNRIIKDMQGQIITGTEARLKSPVLSFSEFINDSGIKVARFEIHRSIAPLVSRSVIVGACSSLFGLLLFLMFRFFPLRTIREAHDRLRENEKKYRQLLETTHDIIVSVDFDFKVTYVNQAAIDLVGEFELIGKNLLDYTPPEKHELQKTIMRKRQEGFSDVLSFEWEVSYPGAGSKIFDIKSALLTDDGKPSGVMFIARDITARKKAEESLRESEERYRTILDEMEEGYQEVDLAGNYTFANEAFLRIFGCSKDEIIGANFRQYSTEESAKEVFHAYEKIYKTGIPIKRSLRWDIIRKDGARRTCEFYASLLLDAKGDCIGFRGIGRDITDRKRTEDALRASEELYNRLVNTIPDVIVRTNLDGKILFVNNYTIQISGYQREELEGQDMIGFIAREDQDKLLQNAILMMQNRLGPQEYQMVMKDGRKIPFDVNGDVLRGAGGDPFGLVFVCRDISDRKYSEDKLRENEARLRGITTNIPGIVYQFFAAGDGRYGISYVSEHYWDTFGLYESDMEKMFSEFISHVYPDDRDRFMTSVLNASVTYLPWNFEGRYTKPSGEMIWFQCLSTPTRRDGTLFFDGIMLDITDRKKIENELEKLASIVKHSGELINLANLDGMMLFMNEAGCRILGIDQDQVSKFNIRNVIPDKLLPVFQDKLLPALRTGGAWEGELQYKNLKNGGLVDVYAMTFVIGDPVSKAPLYLVNISRDISERKRAEEELRQSEDKFRKVFMTTPDGIVITRLRDGKIMDVNRGFEDIAGWEGSAVIGRTSLEINFWRDPEERAVMVNELKAGRDIIRREFQFRRSNGDLRDGVYSARSIGIADEACLVFSVQDVTEVKRLEDDRQKLEQQLFQSRKMESVGRLAGGIAHDFNNMLAVIIGNTEMIMDTISSSDPVYQFLQDVLNAGMRSAELTRQLLAFARKQAAVPKVLDMNETVTGMLKMLQRLIGENISLAWMPGRELWNVKIDPSQVDQLLANLMVNARDAMDKTGRIVIETSNIACDEAYCSELPDSVAGEYVLLSVSDNGCGMEKEILTNIFEPFFTTKKEGQGTGLGLATVYGIVKQNGGFINIYSEPGHGTTFKIYLPRYTDESQEIKDEQQDMEPQGGTETILVVEDEKSVLNLTSNMLEILGYKVLPASNSEMALQVATEYHESIDLLLTDVVMPDMNGKDLSERIIAAKPGIKCLFMSGYTADVIARQGILDEDIQFISKPFSLKELASQVRKSLSIPVV